MNQRNEPREAVETQFSPPDLGAYACPPLPDRLRFSWFRITNRQSTPELGRPTIGPMEIVTPYPHVVCL